MTYNILVIEDDNDINKLLVTILSKSGYQVTSAFSGTEAMLHLNMKAYDLLVLDLMLPGMSGEEVIKEVQMGKTMPIIVLTAKGGLTYRVNLLESGADDYVIKPFEVPELLARIQAQLRRVTQFMKQSETRPKGQSTTNVEFGELSLYPDSLTSYVKETEIELTAHEFRILQTLIENPNKVFSKESLYESVWENGYYGEDNTISVHISNIRKKIADVTEKTYIKTVWGIGYKMNL